MKTIYDNFGDEVSLHDLCHLIYQGFGQQGVQDFIRAMYDKRRVVVMWNECEPCEDKMPFVSGSCLVCGTYRNEYTEL